jgi:hypothetical protein
VHRRYIQFGFAVTGGRDAKVTGRTWTKKAIVRALIRCMALQRTEMSRKNKFETGANANVAGDDVSHHAEDGAWRFLGESMAEGGGPVRS